MPKQTEKSNSIASRMALRLVLLSTFAFSLAYPLNLAPNTNQAEIRRKGVICEILAITSSLLAQRHQQAVIEENFAVVVKRYPEITSACLRRPDGAVMYQCGDHQAHWRLRANAPSTPDNIFVPIKNGSEPWATVELSFHHGTGLRAIIARYPFITLGLFCLTASFLLFRWYLARAFSYLDPSRSVPMHVRATLDTFSEGVVVFDNDQRIVLANEKFRQHVGKSDEELLGRNINELDWQDEDLAAPHQWQEEMPGDGKRLGLQRDDEHRTYLVNTSTILDSNGERKGAIASFDDITPLEENRKKLSAMLRDLQTSRAELSQRNEELQYLATRDSLTGCLNRRTFFELFDMQWAAAQRQQHPLSCFMVDVDHFKSVNDTHGHSVGDEVLRRVAETIQEAARKSDVVCRYGGEEFCMLLPETSLSEATAVAERLRVAVEQLEFESPFGHGKLWRVLHLAGGRRPTGTP